MKAVRVLSLLASSAACFGVVSCMTDNDAAYDGILGRSVRPAPEEPGTNTGGASAEGGAGGSTGGSPPMTMGGGSAGTSGTGGGGAGATGGSSGGDTGGAGVGGTAGAGAHPPTHPDFSPACFLYTTTSGEEILKGTPCTPEDPPLCYRPCGPNQVGWKTETCLAGVYAEGDCTFPSDREYSCYAIPAVIDEAACGLTAPPAATAECTAPLCMSCNFGGFYQDTGSDVKEGFCSCREPDQEGVRRWTCASTTAWPCPFSQGC